MKTGVELIIIERAEQIEKHGRSVERDFIENDSFQLTNAVSKLLLLKVAITDYTDIEPPKGWSRETFTKIMNKTYEERLIIAGALIAAEYDRISFSYKKELTPDSIIENNGSPSKVNWK